MKTKFVALLYLILYAVPLIILFSTFKFNQIWPDSNIILPLSKTIIQSTLASIICIVIALLCASDFSSLSLRYQKWLSQAAMFPIMLPSVFTILLAFSIWDPFPYGSVGIVSIFVLMYLGYSLVLIKNIYSVKILPYLNIKDIYRISKLNFWLKIVFPLIYKDVIQVFLVIFISTATSLSVPLVAAKSGAQNLELYLYDLIYVQGAWDQASLISCIQILVLFLVYQLSNNKVYGLKISQKAQTKRQRRGLVSYLIEGYLILYVYFFLSRTLILFKPGFYQTVNFDDFARALVNSIFLTLVMFIFMGLGFYGLIYLIFSKSKFQALRFVVLPSTTIVGFSLFLLFPMKGPYLVEIIKVSLAFLILYLSLLFKNFIEPFLDTIYHQMTTARIYNITYNVFFFKILVPQSKSTFRLVGALLSLMIFSDFAVIKSAGSQTLFLGTYLQVFLEGYRLEQAYGLSILILVFWFLFFILIQYLVKGLYVTYRKFKI